MTSNPAYIITSYNDVYSNPIIIALAQKYSQAYISPADLLQEAAFAIWQFLQDKQPPSPFYLFGVAKHTMRTAAKAGRSIDKPWITYRRPDNAIPTILGYEDLYREESTDSDKQKLWTDPKTSQTEGITSLRDMLHLIYSHKGYTDTEQAILQSFAAGLTHQETRNSLKLPTRKFTTTLQTLRTKIILQAFKGNNIDIASTNPGHLQLSEQEATVHRLVSERLSSSQIANRLKISPTTVAHIVRRIRIKQTLINLGLPPSLYNKDGKAANRAWL